MNKLWAAMIVPVVGIFGAAASVYADSTLVTVNVSDTSLELDVPASPTILTLNPTASGANFGSIDLTATVGTNNPNGYQLSVTFSNTSLSRTVAVDGTTPTIDTLDTLAGGYPVADFTVNRWGHKITGDNYFPVPSSTLSPESWSSDEPVNNAPNVITLAAKADGNIPSGIYETTLTYTLVANVATTTSFEDAYAAAGKIRDNNTGKYKLQDMNASICANVDTSTAADNSDTQEAQLVDTRDGKVYWVAKLKDGKCWMTQNLDLDLETTPNHVLALTSENTDLNTYGSNGYDTSNGYSKDANDIITWEPERDTIPTSSISTDGTITGWTNDHSNPYSIDTGEWYWTDTWYTSTTNNYLDRDNSGAGDKFSQFSTSFANGTHGHVGNYYNWTAAIASNDSSSYTSDTYNDISGNPQNSICPAGWRLPTIYNSTTDSKNEFRYLLDRYGAYITSGTERDKALTASPLWFVRGGGVSSVGGLGSSGNFGFSWSSTVYDSSSTYYLSFYSSRIDPTYYNGNRNRGWSVRCIARDTAPDPDPSTTTFDEAFAAASKTKDTNTNKYKMQDMTTNICNAVTAPTQADNSDTQETQLVDTRDNKLYWVAKLKDGHCWMTQNLDLDLETTPNHVLALTSENTDLNTFGSNGYDTDNGYSQEDGVITWEPERSTIPTSSITSTGSISGWTNDYNNPYSIDTGDWYWIGNWKNNGTNTWYNDACTSNPWCNYLSGNENGKFSTSVYAGNGKHGHVGNYYNWSAAIASNNSSSYNASTLADITTNPQNSICPSGWRLPTVSNASDTDDPTNEFRRLVTTLYGNTTSNDKALTASPLWFVRGGGVNSSSLYNSGYYGYYWSSTVYSSNYAYYLYFNSSYVDPADYIGRLYGWSVRCIAR